MLTFFSVSGGSKWVRLGNDSADLHCVLSQNDTSYEDALTAMRECVKARGDTALYITVLSH